MNPLLRSDSSLRSYRNASPITIRWAGSSDRERLDVLAELDEAVVPAPPLLLAFVGEDLWAARSLSSGVHISDPFRPSAEVAALLAERGRQLTVREREPRVWLLRWRRRQGAVGVGARLGGEAG